MMEKKCKPKYDNIAQHARHMLPRAGRASTLQGHESAEGLKLSR